ncbi:hypothetical protein M9Y10_042997 [Tritrichomonas musculus]|uniref:Leucine-rich repeat domain-containing protein n=1 Tax=Tritrichomonas musculus TaxID=1915356 RepID=A0ABR2JZL5_9EUKA
MSINEQVKNITQNDIIYVLNESIHTSDIQGNNKISGDIVIPRSIQHDGKEYTVTNILESAFERSYLLKSIKFPPDSGLLSIHNDAFRYSSISSINIPPHVTYIGKYAFIWCEKLRNFEIPDNTDLQIIDEYAFSRSSLRRIYIPSDISALKNGWCAYTPKLAEVNIIQRETENIKYFDNKNFIVGKTDLSSEEYDILVYARRDLVQVNIPPFIKEIGSFAFVYCSFEKIFIPSQVTIIGDGSFAMNNKLKVVDILENSELRIIKRYAFSFTSLKRIFIPKKVTEIGEYCFAFSALEKVDFDDNSLIEKIGKVAFSCSIKSFFVPRKLKIISASCLRNIQNLLIEIDENSEIESLDSFISELSSTKLLIMAPKKLIDSLSNKNI